MLDEYDVSWVILRPTEALSHSITMLGTWVPTYSDEHAVVFVRSKKLERAYLGEANDLQFAGNL